MGLDLVPLRKSYFVYLIRSEHFWKIGSAAYPERRLLELQCGNPRPLWLWEVRDFGWRERAQSAEFGLHERLQGQRVRGEWFKRKPLDPLTYLNLWHSQHLKLVEADAA